MGAQASSQRHSSLAEESEPQPQPQLPGQREGKRAKVYRAVDSVVSRARGRQDSLNSRSRSRTTSPPPASTSTSPKTTSSNVNATVAENKQGSREIQVTAPAAYVTAAVPAVPAVTPVAPPAPSVPSAIAVTVSGARQDNSGTTPADTANSLIMPAATVPCQYKTGKTLGSGTYAVVKEAVHIKTGRYYACKLINKKLMEGREYMVRNEIAVLKRISSNHANIVTLHDYFETSNNLYLVFELCTGGELFDRICAKGNYYEADAAALIRTIFRAVKYLHAQGVVHRDLKPENLLFRTKAENADIMIADFGLSRVVEEEKFHLLTEICGTPGYMAPEIFKKTGHGKPVDVWAMGVITYFLLCGYTPFDRDTQQEEMEAIIAGDYKFEPEEYWMNVSQTARDFVRKCLTVDPAERPTSEEALEHRWLADDSPHFVENAQGNPTNLLPYIQKQFDAKKTWRKAFNSLTAVKMFTANKPNLSPAAQAFAPQLAEYKKESERESIGEEFTVTHYGNSDPERTPEGGVSPSSSEFNRSPPASPHQPLAAAMAKMSIDKPEQ